MGMLDKAKGLLKGKAATVAQSESKETLAASNLALEKKQQTALRIGLTANEADSIVVDHRPPPPKDTRKKTTVLQIQVKPQPPGVGPKSPTKKKKKKKVKLDPKGEYAKLMAEEQAAIDAANNEDLEVEVENEDDAWHDCVRCYELAEMRTLIGDGEYLCHDCYWHLHPEVARREQQGEDFVEKEVLEGEECRSCLDQAYLRRCCNEFYCHKCYLRTEYCPGCNQKNTQRGLGQDKPDPGTLAVMGAWLISFAFVTFVGSMGFAIWYNELTLPETVWGYKCYGFYPTCDIDICVDLQGPPSDGIISPANYSFCDLQTTVNKMRGKVCVFDEELYKRTEFQMGFDFCFDVKGLYDDPSVEFTNGVFVFEDNFDYWLNKTDYSQDSIGMASALWNTMTNAEVADYCGVNLLPGDLDYPRMAPGVLRGEGSLHFSGVLERQAVTESLDMEFGGNVQFYLKLAAIVANEDQTRCKTAFAGDVHLLYSIDDGVNWIQFGLYPVYIYRSMYFKEVIEELPEAAWSNNTMFKWEQPYFESARDYWAIDDVKIFHRFHPDWRERGIFKQKQVVVEEEVQVAQCCFETEQCENDPATFLGGGDCAEVPGWDGDNYYVLRGADAYIAIASLLALAKFLYNFAVHMLSEGDVLVADFTKRYMPRACRLKKKAAMFDFQLPKDDEPPPGMMAEGAFEIVVHPKFKKFVFLCFAGPYVIAVLWMIAVTNSYVVYQPFVSFGNVASLEESTFKDQPPYVEPDGVVQASSGFIVFLAMTMDFSNIYWLAKHVYCLMPKWVPEVSIDTNPRNNWLRIGKQKIVLTDVREIHRFSKKYCWWVHFLYQSGGLPWCSVCMVLKGFWWTYEDARLAIGIVGFVACFRAFFGATLFVKFAFAMEYILTQDDDLRDEMGLALKTDKIRYLSFFCFLVVSTSVGLAISTYYFTSKVHSFILSILCGLLGSVYGLTLGLLQGLPVLPEFKLTRWPEEGHHTVYERKLHCPCIFYCAYCTEMHTRLGYNVVWLDNMQSYHSMLKGEPEIPPD